MGFSRKDFLKAASAVSLFGLTSGFKTTSRNSVLNQSPVKPKALKRGDTLGLIAPGSPIYESSVFDKMLLDLRNLGFRLKLGKHVKNQRGYLAGTDEERTEDLMSMFEDPGVQGIICIRGGWGCNRILPLIDFGVIRDYPKPFVGFSDITSLHMAIQKKTSLVTFHGPVGKSTWNSFTASSFSNVLIEGKEEQYKAGNSHSGAFTIQPGSTSGRLLGGNLSVLTAMIGSDFLPDFEGAILFLEDIGEDVYRIDRMLTQLSLAGILGKINGFIFGKCTDCEAGENSLSLKQVFEDHLLDLNIPAFYGADISHEDDNVTLPVGLNAKMDAGKKTIRLLEPAVQVSS